MLFSSASVLAGLWWRWPGDAMALTFRAVATEPHGQPGTWSFMTSSFPLFESLAQPTQSDCCHFRRIPMSLSVPPSVCPKTGKNISSQLGGGHHMVLCWELNFGAGLVSDSAILPSVIFSLPQFLHCHPGAHSYSPTVTSVLYQRQGL